VNLEHAAVAWMRRPPAKFYPSSPEYDRAVAGVRALANRPPVWVPAMAVATVLYLVLELSFNARLLDVTGGQATAAQISSIEKWGRVISGLAFTLFVWGSFILPWAFPGKGRPSWGRVRLIGALVLSAALCMQQVYHHERSLVDRVVERSDGVQRRAAVQLQTLSAAILSGSAAVEGVDLDAGQLARPEGKTFLAMFPFVALSVPGLQSRTDAVIAEAIRRTMVSANGPEISYDEGFIPSVQALHTLYMAYETVASAYRTAVAGIPGQTAQAWNAYAPQLARLPKGPDGGIPRPYWTALQDQVRGTGVPVSAGWNPVDRAGFEATLAHRLQAETSSAYRTQLQRNLGTVLPSDLSWEAFAASVPMQERWHHLLGTPATVIGAISPTMGFEFYRERIWQPTLDAAVQARLQAVTAPSSDFADGGCQERLGRDAMEFLAVPPIALGFSLLGALFHLFKAANYLLRWRNPSLRWRKTRVALPVVALALAAFLSANTVSASQAFSILQSATASAHGPIGLPISLGVRWAVQAQPWFYPINETIRRTLMLGYGFGY
jgi:hypothetical protein